MGSSWRDYAREVKPAEGDCANSANSANSSPVEPIGTNDPNGTASLPAPIRKDVEGLAALPVPRGADPVAWACSVRSALGLVADGWAAQALNLGWSALDLFGGSIDKDADPYCDGLAVWLAGRKVLALDEARAIAGDAKGNRWYFNRPRAEGARFLWALNGRG